jgi:mono/diheme cytochrome c family protein
MLDNSAPMPSGISPANRRSRFMIAMVFASFFAGSAALLWQVARYDVASTRPHSSVVEWVLQRTMQHSVRLQASDVSVPAGIDLRDRALGERAIGHYSVACAPCHSAPGEAAAPWMVLYPAAPDLTRAEVVAQWSDSELYWLIKHGIKDTGMIALGPTHSEQDLWAVSAFVRQLPDMTPERYRSLREQYRAQRAAAEHMH